MFNGWFWYAHFYLNNEDRNHISGQEPHHLPTLSPPLEQGMNACWTNEWLWSSFLSPSMEAKNIWPFPLHHEPPKELAKSVFLQILSCFYACIEKPVIVCGNIGWATSWEPPSFSTRSPVSWEPPQSQANWDVWSPYGNSLLSGPHCFLHLHTWGLVLVWSLHLRSTILGTGWRGRGESKKEARLKLGFSEISLFWFCRM